MHYLTVDSGPDQGNRYELPGTEYFLGRHPDCHIVIEVGAVSRRHARVIREGDSYYVEDLDSRNGTYLNDEKIQGRRRLRDGDQLRVCDVSFTFHGVAKEESSTSASDGSSIGRIVVEDSANSKIMSKLDVSSNQGSIHLTASAEEKLLALLDITRNLASAVGLDEVLPKVLNTLFRIFVQADRGFVILKDEKGGLIPRWSKLRREDSDDTLRISRTVVQEVLESKQAILSADAATDVRFETSESVADFRIRSMMCTPLINSDGEAVGVLQVDTLDQKKRFDQKDLEVLSAVATQAAAAIENAKRHEDVLNQREVERDLHLAHEVQQSFLPKESPRLEQYEFFDYYCPANHVGGDYFDYIKLNDGRIAIVVADVVGHGVAAALLMAKLSAEVRFSLASAQNPADAITHLNRRFASLHLNRFATLVMVALDPNKHEATIVNCGHMPPIIRRANGTIEEPGTDLSGIPVGIMESVTYNQFKIDLAPSEMVMLYTDGLNEAMNGDSECYGIDRLRRHMVDAGEPISETGEVIVADVRRFIGKGSQDDDMCLVCFGRRGRERTKAANRETIERHDSD